RPRSGWPKRERDAWNRHARRPVTQRDAEDDRRRQWRSRQGALVLPAHDLELEIEPELLELRAHLGGSVGNLGRGGFSDEDAMGRVRHLRLENEIVSGKKRAQRLCALSFRDEPARE